MSAAWNSRLQYWLPQSDFDNERSEPELWPTSCANKVRSECSLTNSLDVQLGTRPVALCLDQIGAGQGLIGAQKTEPAYAWGNVMKGSGSANIAIVPEVSTQFYGNTTYIMLNRDYYNAAKPGYTPYSYPHPLRSGNPAPPSGLTAPQRLRIF